MTIKGDPTLGRTLISLRAMLRTIRHEGQGFYVELNHFGADYANLEANDDPIDVPKKLVEILRLFQQLFQMPTEFPPNRGHEHAITLNEGTSPVNAWPYKYPQFLKKKD